MSGALEEQAGQCVATVERTRGGEWQRQGEGVRSDVDGFMGHSEAFDFYSE